MHSVYVDATRHREVINCVSLKSDTRLNRNAPYRLNKSEVHKLLLSQAQFIRCCLILRAQDSLSLCISELDRDAS